MGSRYGPTRPPGRDRRRRCRPVQMTTWRGGSTTVLAYSSVMTDAEERGAGGRPVPRYIQVADAVADQIRAGVHPPGGRIPSLRRLHEQHEVSMTTAVEACRLLEARGLVRARD